MDITLKLLVVALVAFALVSFVVVVERRIARFKDLRWQLFARSLLYAIAFTPTAYHHAPNTIVAPLHLSTLCGTLFYAYDYTVEMFLYGVAVPLTCGWMLITLVLLFRNLPRSL